MKQERRPLSGDWVPLLERFADGKATAEEAQSVEAALRSNHEAQDAYARVLLSRGLMDLEGGDADDGALKFHEPLACAAARRMLDAHAEGGLDARATVEVAAHLQDCADCRELADARSRWRPSRRAVVLSSVVALLLIGGAAATYWVHRQSAVVASGARAADDLFNNDVAGVAIALNRLGPRDPLPEAMLATLSSNSALQGAVSANATVAHLLTLAASDDPRTNLEIMYLGAFYGDPRVSDLQRAPVLAQLAVRVGAPMRAWLWEQIQLSSSPAIWSEGMHGLLLIGPEAQDAPELRVLYPRVAAAHSGSAMSGLIAACFRAGMADAPDLALALIRGQHGEFPNPYPNSAAYVLKYAVETPMPGLITDLENVALSGTFSIGRLDALDALRRHAPTDPRWTPAFISMRHDPDPMVRRSVVRHLGQVDPVLHHELISSFLSDPDASVRKAALKALHPNP